ncbi:MAG: RIP metalloprotease RseP [Alphaproteobacteria bacterium]|nr:RIP metalloprotease RseP [Alphaproteobacteria bacterium]
MVTVLHNLVDWAPLGIPAFIFVVTLVVFFHESGHFLVARLCGVAVETFSIGFGGEIIGWNDRKGTRWKISWLPFGGYVKFLGDEGAASTPDREQLEKISPEQRASVFAFKPVWQRVLVVAAGPVANFILAFVVFFLLYTLVGARGLSTYVGAVQPHSPAAMAGIRAGDKITAVNGHPVRLFYDEMQPLIQAAKNQTLRLTFERQGRQMTVPVTPGLIDNTDIYGGHLKTIGIGISPASDTALNTVYLPVPIAKAPLIAAAQCWGIVDLSLTYLWRIVSHHADTSQLAGPIGVASMAKTEASHGFYALLTLVAFFSVSIGLINLFPIPLLDGGHLLYYACEAVLGRPLDARTQDVGFRVGLALVLGLVLFATWNDLVR